MVKRKRSKWEKYTYQQCVVWYSAMAVEENVVEETITEKGESRVCRKVKYLYKILFFQSWDLKLRYLWKGIRFSLRQWMTAFPQV